MVAQMQADNPPEQVCDIWPENEKAVDLFLALRTQLIVGPGGAVGINYAAIECVRRSVRLSARKASRLLPSLQIMENELLCLIHASD
jgi:hypothetical protein